MERLWQRYKGEASSVIRAQHGLGGSEDRQPLHRAGQVHLPDRTRLRKWKCGPALRRSFRALTPSIIGSERRRSGPSLWSRTWMVGLLSPFFDALFK